VAKKTIDQQIAAMEAATAKVFGNENISRFGSKKIEPIEVIPSGCISLDRALGVGGYPKGRVVEIYGPESSGKTTLTLHAIAECQVAGGIAAFVDAEHAFDPKYAQALGVNMKRLLFSQPDTGEIALGVVDSLVDQGADLVVIDSVAALTPRAEIEGEMGDSHVGLQARLMGQALRKLTGKISRHGTCVIFINQIRLKIGVMFGSPETTSGGNALKFYASQRLDIRRIGGIKPPSGSDGAHFVGNRTRVKIVKNKVASPYEEAEFDIMYGQGMSAVGDVLDLGTDTGLIDKSGAWYSFEGERLGQGRENAKATLQECPELFEHITQMVREVVL